MPIRNLLIISVMAGLLVGGCATRNFGPTADPERARNFVLPYLPNTPDAVREATIRTCAGEPVENHPRSFSDQASAMLEGKLLLREAFKYRRADAAARKFYAAGVHGWPMPGVYWGLAAAASEAGWPEETVDACIARASPHWQTTAFFHSDVGVIAFRRGNYAEAEARFRRAIELDRTYYLLINNLRLALIALGKEDAAEAVAKDYKLPGRIIRVTRPFWFGPPRTRPVHAGELG